jgi:hypothetical protein
MEISEFDLDNINLDKSKAIQRVEHSPPLVTSDRPSHSIPTTSPPPTSLSKTEPDQLAASLPFHNAASLLRVCERENLTLAQVVFKNELQWRSAEEIKARTMNIWHAMNESIENGIKSTETYLPGPLKVRRRKQH